MDTIRAVAPVVLALCTLAGGIWALIALVKWIRTTRARRPLPTYSTDQLRARLKIVAVDDNGFTYFTDFKNEGYGITQLRRVKNYAQLETYESDVLILDVQGIASELTVDDGLGVARQVRVTCESMPIIIYSGASYQLAVDKSAADHVFDISGDYRAMKVLVDGLFQALTGPDFYVRNFDSGHGSNVTTTDYERLKGLVHKILIDPNTDTDAIEYSSHETTTRASEVARHARAVSARLHRTD